MKTYLIETGQALFIVLGSVVFMWVGAWIIAMTVLKLFIWTGVIK